MAGVGRLGNARPEGMLVADQEELQVLARDDRPRPIVPRPGCRRCCRRGRPGPTRFEPLAARRSRLARRGRPDARAGALDERRPREAQRIHDEGVASLELAGDITLAISAAFDRAELRKARGRLSEARRL